MNDILTVTDLHKALKNSFYDKQPEKYISIHQGWYNLVLQCHIELLNIDPFYRIFQIKEKFGSLRYYIEPSEDYWETPQDERIALTAIIAKYEAMSRVTCELTGQNGLLMKSPTGWFKTLNPVWASFNPPYDQYVVVDS